ncbi:MAG: tetratricopeptide repeat protein [Deltaproteobacteria bacterium]|nr:tetratricopeptide repeat protein [Deltaproteobacteria bacterium]
MKHVGISALIGLLLFPSCSWYERTAGKMRKKEGGTTYTKQVPGEKGPVKLEVQKLEGTNLATIQSPQRAASMRVVDQGRGELSRGQLDAALQTFQEAVTLDGSNGVAYYYLARAHYQLGHHEQAMGLLERAEALLGKNAGWELTIEALREMIRNEADGTNPGAT